MEQIMEPLGDSGGGQPAPFTATVGRAESRLTVVTLVGTWGLW